MSMDYKSANRLLTFLNIVDEPSTECLQLPPDVRQHILAELEGCLIDVDRLGAYLELLEERAKEPRHSEEMEELRREEVLRSGLSILKDEELARLALNPFALLDLHRWILGEFTDDITDYWELRVCAKCMQEQFDEQQTGNETALDKCLSAATLAEDRLPEITAKKLVGCGMDTVTHNDIDETRHLHIENPAETLSMVSLSESHPLRETRRFHLHLRPSFVNAAANKPLPISLLPQPDEIELETGGILHCTVFRDSEGKVVMEFTTSSQQMKGRRILVSVRDEEDGKEILLKEPVPLGVDKDGVVLSAKFDLTVLNLQHSHIIEYSLDMAPI